MEDRCRHCLAPLSRGRWEGDDIRCIYHSIKFAASCRGTRGDAEPGYSEVTSQAITPISARETVYYSGRWSKRDSDAALIEAQQKVLDASPGRAMMTLTFDRSIAMFHRPMAGLMEQETLNHEDFASGAAAAAQWMRGTTRLPGASMRDDADIIGETLELIAARVGDPTPHVFQRLFRDSPEVEALFVRDPGGLVRGQMFQVTIESLLDFLGDRQYGANLVQIERVNHEGLGVDPDVFDTFYRTVVATFKDILGLDWTSEMEDAWTRVVGELIRPRA